MFFFIKERLRPAQYILKPKELTHVNTAQLQRIQSGNQQRREGNTVFKRQLLNCYHRFLSFYQGQYPPTKHGVMVAESNAQSEHQVWYADSGANACITSNAQNITHLLPFNGGETITVENDTCLLIKSIEFASLQIDQSDFQPSNILHCPYAFYKLTFYQ